MSSQLSEREHCINSIQRYKYKQQCTYVTANMTGAVAEPSTAATTDTRRIDSV